MNVKISDIKTMRNGTVIDSFSGRITKVYEQKTGVGEFGPWHLQNLIVADETGQVQATWSGEDPFDIEAEGQTWHFESAEGKKGLAGLKWEIRTKNGKTYQSVKMDDRCKIKPMNGGDAPLTSTPLERSTKTRSSTGNAAPTSEPESAANGIDETRKHLMQASNLMLLCINAAKYVAEQMPEQADTAEQRQSLIAQLFIEASHKRTSNGIDWWSYVDRMPTHPIQ